MLKLKNIFRFLAIDWPSLQAITRKQKNLVRGISERGGAGGQLPSTLFGKSGWDSKKVYTLAKNNLLCPLNWGAQVSLKISYNE